jgi:predicted TIM-barrel fold metal-dependent hydrolase
MKPVGEVEFVQGLAAQSASGGYGPARVAAGIVGTANLQLGEDVAPVLEAELAASPGRMRGVRHRAAWPEPKPPVAGQPASMSHLLLDANFRQGCAVLGRYGLSFEAWVFHPNLPDVADFAGAFPNMTIVLNHLGGPILTLGKPDEIFTAWRKDLSAVAAHENVVVKLGGIQKPITGLGWHERETPPTSDALLATNRRWYEHAMETFGPNRCMFESNFPVDRAACSYTVLWNQFKKLCAGFPEDERVAMLHDTAAHVYRLSLAAETS